MRVFISTVSDELEPYRSTTTEVVRALGLEISGLEVSASGNGRSRTVAERLDDVTAADAVVAIVGWRLGEVPGPEVGGDDWRPYASWELIRAFEAGKPVVAFLADESWPERLRELDPENRARVQDLRGQLRRLACGPQAIVPLDGARLESA